VIAVLLAKLSTLGVAAKAGIAAGALAATGSAAAATGTLPPPAQDRVAAAVERLVGLEIPGGSRADAEHRQDTDRRQDGEHRPADGAGDATNLDGVDLPEPIDPDTPAQAEMGKTVSGLARSGAPREDGPAFGQTVSSMARQDHGPSGRPTATDNPGTPHAENAGSQAPASPPATDDTTGSDNPTDSGTPSPLPTPDNNPGTPYASDPGAPDPLPTRDNNPGVDRRP